MAAGSKPDPIPDRPHVDGEANAIAGGRIGAHRVATALINVRDEVPVDAPFREALVDDLTALHGNFAHLAGAVAHGTLVRDRGANGCTEQS